MHVSSILNGRISLVGPEASLEKLGYNREIQFKDKGPLEENAEFISHMLELNNKGFAFSYDSKTPLSPSAAMLLLQDNGKLANQFKEIAWKDQKSWFLTTYELE